MSLRLGHITYSNCYPLHAGLLASTPPWLELRRGVPSELNAALAAGDIDVAPSSSIEYARHEGYRVLPGLAIASDGPVRSIIFETTAAPEALDGARVALPTASATSVVLLRALLELRHGVKPVYDWFRQGPAADPVGDGAAAALWIGDVALARPRHEGRTYLDLGSVWREWTHLPFVYAIWQTPLGAERDAELARLSALLLASHEFFLERTEALARQEAAGFGLAEDRLLDYWQSLRYTLDERAVEGLLRFYALAQELGEGRPVTSLCFVRPA